MRYIKYLYAALYFYFSDYCTQNFESSLIYHAFKIYSSTVKCMETKYSLNFLFLLFKILRIIFLGEIDSRRHKKLLCKQKISFKITFIVFYIQLFMLNTNSCMGVLRFSCLGYNAMFLQREKANPLHLYSKVVNRTIQNIILALINTERKKV